MIIVKGPAGYCAIRDKQPDEKTAQQTCREVSSDFQFKTVECITNAKDLPPEVDLALRTIVTTSSITEMGTSLS